MPSRMVQGSASSTSTPSTPSSTGTHGDDERQPGDRRAATVNAHLAAPTERVSETRILSFEGSFKLLEKLALLFG